MSQFIWKTALTLFASLHFTQAWRLVCFKGSLSNSFNVTLENATLQITSGYIDITKPTVMCTHGYGGTIFTQGTNQLTAAYLLLGFNVCALDYSKEANSGSIPVVQYPLSIIVAAYRVAGEVAQAIVDLVRLGFNVKTFHMIGHSLGAHVCGNIGAFFKTITGIPIYRITGLDAAGPGFDGPIYPLQRLSKEDGDFVVLIHTDYIRGLGMAAATGHQDIFICPFQYRRDGVQPGCSPVGPVITDRLTPAGACSHRRSVDVYSELVNDICQMLAAKADSETEFVNPAFVPDVTICVGEYTNQTYHGKFYVRTNDRSPFALGVAGLTAQ